MNDTITKLRNTLVATEVLTTILNKPRITPKLITEEVGYSRPYVKNTLRILSELKLVETPVRGTYIITDLGRSVLKEVAEPPQNYGLGETPTEEKSDE